MTQEFTPDSEFASLETPRYPNKLQSLTALARFEFEPGKSNEGTKILMVEWEDDDLSRSPAGSWHVSWDGKQTVLPADEQTTDHVRRCYFLLPPNTTVPPSITLTYEPPPSSASTVKKADSITINPLPAIFPPELGATARTAGKKGVLHTIWAKKRMQVLEKEVKRESKYNQEGVALVMALQEQEWIESNFGVGAKALPALQTGGTATSNNAVPLSPTTPISPGGGGRLADKLKGLKLGTSEKDLTRRSIATNVDAHLHPLSPEEPDVAISSFGSFHIAKPPMSVPQLSDPTSQPQKEQKQDQTQKRKQEEEEQQQQQQEPKPKPKSHEKPDQQSATKQPIAHAPPDFIQFYQQQQLQQGHGFASLSSMGLNGNTVTAAPIPAPDTTSSTVDAEDDLFAKALSPRSPDIPKSPFSFAPEETKPYAVKQLNA